MWSTPLVVLLGTVASFLEGLGIGLLIPLSEVKGGAMPSTLPGPIRELGLKDCSHLSLLT